MFDTSGASSPSTCRGRDGSKQAPLVYPAASPQLPAHTPSNASGVDDGPPAHACGVDDVEQLTSIRVPNPVLSVGHFCRARLGHSWLAPKDSRLPLTITESPPARPVSAS